MMLLYKLNKRDWLYPAFIGALKAFLQWLFGDVSKIINTTRWLWLLLYFHLLCVTTNGVMCFRRVALFRTTHFSL